MILGIHHDPKVRRSTHIALAMAKGADMLGLKHHVVPNFNQVAGDVGIAYGWAHPELFQAYRANGGHFVHVDLGWWRRKPVGDVLGGYHKVVVDGREPGPYFRSKRPADRLTHMNLEICPWRTTGHHILVAGMSEKSARTRGFAPQQWEAATIRALQRAYPSRPIVYRPKPSWSDASPIQGASYSPPTQTVEQALFKCWAVVCCHSNVAVDALVAGIPMHVEDGVAREFSQEIAEFDRFQPREGRHQLLADIAYCQWTPREMASGSCLKHLMEHSPLCA